MRIFKKSIALIAALSLMLSMATIVSAAETKTISMNGKELFSITNVVNSYVDTYEDEGEVFHDEVMECNAPVTITVLSAIPNVDIMDHTYEIQNNNYTDTGYIMPDGCPNEKEFWETGVYRENIAAGTTYTLSEPGTYGINLFFEDGTSYYACVEIAGERTKDAANFTKADYRQRRENTTTTNAADNTNALNGNLITYTNITGQAGTVKVENQNTGEIIDGDVYSCLIPIKLKATQELDNFIVFGMAQKTGANGETIWYPDRPYLADNEDDNGYYERTNGGKTRLETTYTLTGSYEMYYLHASKGEEEINVVLRVDGTAPINVSNGKRTESVFIWTEIPSGSVTIEGLYDITYFEGEPIYVVDKDSEIYFCSYLSDTISVYADGDGNSTSLLDSKVCTPTVYETITYDDNEFWYDEESAMIPTTQVKPGMTVKFNKVGEHWIHFGPGYASRDERLAIQFNDDSLLGWQYWPTMIFKVIDPAPTANYTASKVIVNGVETEFEAYNINDNNYFKLRDVAMAINGTEKQFSVFWDGNKNAISLISRGAYTPVGGELAKGDGTSKAAAMTSSVVYKDEKPVNFTAYNINGNNYFKLRDLGEAFGFDVSWDAANNCIIIDTSKGYTAD